MKKEIRTVTDLEDFIERHGPAGTGKLNERTAVVFRDTDGRLYTCEMQMWKGQLVISS